MKKHLSFISLLTVVLLASYLNANAERSVTIEGYPIAGGGDITAFIDAIDIALTADAPNRETDPDVTYILKRDHLYPSTKTIKNDFYLRMVAEEGTGAIPVILEWEKEGSYKRLLEAAADVYFENIEFDNKTPVGVTKARSQRLSANGVRGEFVGCVVYGDDGGAFNIYADNCKIFLTDCFVHNCGTEGANDSNGRFLDVRADNTCDSVVITNCTGDHLNGSFVRSGNAVINYLEVNHCTSFNSRSGNISAFRAKEVVLINNLFKDAQMAGDVPSLNDPAQTNPDLFNSSCFAFDSIWDASKITIRNNNIFYTDEVKAMWAKYDTIYEPLRVNPMAMRALGPDSIHAAFSEVISFTTACPPPIAYIEAAILDATLTEYPSQHCKGGEGETGFFPTEMDCSYETSSASYTAADDGYPLGDLNWFPEMKAKWENGETVNVFNNRVTDLFKVYPNPAKDKLFISNGDQSNVHIVLYDVLGKEVQSLVSNGGDIEVNVSKLPKGMYIYRIDNTNGQVLQSGKVLITK